MLSTHTLGEARQFLAHHDLMGWLIHDHHSSNPVFSQLVGDLGMMTRPHFLFIPARGEPCVLVHHVDAGKVQGLGLADVVYRDRGSMVRSLQSLLAAGGRIAMEYSPMGEVPTASLVDAGTIELVRSLGAEVVSSADLLQYATLRWSEAELKSHRQAADKLGRIVMEAFNYVGHNLAKRLTEHQVAEFIRHRFIEEDLVFLHGPIVAANQHGSDPHYEPQAEAASPIVQGDWLLIDLWAKQNGEGAMYADITWVAFVGVRVPPRHQEVFDVVIGARDASVRFLEECARAGHQPEGWQVDAVARAHIERAGYGDNFTHRLGHSLGLDVHGGAVNLDGFETHDTRTLIPGIGFTIEPGVYLPDFGMRSEIDVYMSEEGPLITTPVQQEVVLISPS